MKQIIKQCSVILLLMFCFFTSQAQVLEKTPSGYKIGETKYKSKAEILQLLESSPDAYDAYMKSDEYKGNALGFGLASVALLGISYYTYDVTVNSNNESPDFGLIYISGLVGLVGLGFGVTSLVFNTKANKKEKEVVDLYNNSMIGYRDNSLPTKVSIGMNSNGVGLHYTF